MKEQKQKAGHEMAIEVSSDIAAGVYSNLAIITHSKTEFILDFAQMMPGLDKNIVRSRVVMHPLHFRNLCNAIIDNLNKYEHTFGPIDPKAAQPADDDDIQEADTIDFMPRGEA